MKIAVAQIQPIKGNIAVNIGKHLRWIRRAVDCRADVVFFPELSMTSYEPSLADALALNENDERLQVFQSVADKQGITIGLGLPLKVMGQIFISMGVFQPFKECLFYSKQMLHEDEEPFFSSGNQHVLLSINRESIALAICYESLLTEHAEAAFLKGATLYLASVAKPQNGIAKAYTHFPKIAKQFNSAVIMVNSIGPCDHFLSAGQSAIWDCNGTLTQSLPSDQEGMLIGDFVDKEIDVSSFL